VVIRPRTELRPFRRHSVAVGGTTAPVADRAWMFASGLEGTIDLEIATRFGPEEQPPTDASAGESTLQETRPAGDDAADSYALTLAFGLPPGADASDIRRFDVMIDDELLEADVTVTGGAPVIRALPHVRLGPQFRLRLVPRTGMPVLCGLEFHRLPGRE